MQHKARIEIYDVLICAGLFSNFDKDKSGAIDLKEFAALAEFFKIAPGGDVDEGTASVLAKYDTDGDKKLSQSELKVMLTSLGFSVDDAYLTGVMTNFDQDASGSIDANEFKALARRSSLLCAPTLSLTLGTPTVTPSLPMFLRIREAFHSLVSYMILLRGLLMRDKALFE